MLEEIKSDARKRMDKAIDVLRQDLAKLRTGRAHTSLLDHVTVAYYGNQVPLSQVATINVTDARSLSITPWEKSMVPVVEKAILASDLGLTPSTAGTVIRVILPPLTEERRRDMARVVRQEAENARVAIRNIRRDAIADVKALEKAKDLSEDDARKGQEDIQKLTDECIAKADQVMAEKENELMQI